MVTHDGEFVKPKSNNTKINIIKKSIQLFNGLANVTFGTKNLFHINFPIMEITMITTISTINATSKFIIYIYTKRFYL